MHRYFSALGAVSGVLLACSGSDSGGVAVVDVDAACTEAAQVYCTALRGCSSFFVDVTFTDAVQCQSRLKLDCKARFTANGTNFTKAALDACIADVKGTPGCAVLDTPPASCQPTSGSLADGTPCAVDDQCVNKNCRLADDSNCGACSSVSASGTSCVRTSDCEGGFVCANGICAARGKQGDACSPQKPCITSLSCAAGTCAVPLEAGAECVPKAPNDPDDADPCNRLKGAFCHPTRRVCTVVGLAATNEACGVVDGNFVACKAGGYCKRATGTPTGTCLAAAADGAPCGTTDGPSCLSPAKCMGGVCTLSDPNSCR